MVREYIGSFLRTPRRLWRWSQAYPTESIGYGLILLFVALAAKPLIVGAAAVAIVGGLYSLFLGGNK